MATVVEKTGIRRVKGWLYFVDKRGDVSRVPMAQKTGKGGREKVVRCGIEREEGWLYFIDKRGNVAKVKMKRSTRRRPARASHSSMARQTGERSTPVPRPSLYVRRRMASHRSITRST